MRLLEPASYRRMPWKNGGGVAIEIAAEHDAATEGWSGMVWSFSRTGFEGASPFSDLAGYDRIITIVTGEAMTLRARDDGPDIRVLPLTPTGFDGGRAVEGVPDEGRVEVVNLMLSRDRVAGSVRVLRTGDQARIEAGRGLIHAPAGTADVTVAGQPTFLSNDWAIRIDESETILVNSGLVLVASITQLR